jgi:tellurite resistance protein TerC
MFEALAHLAWGDVWAASVIILQLIYLEGILSIDNAAVLGAMVSQLPRHDPIPWPRALRVLQQPANRFLGPQQSAALRAGLVGAYVGRGAMLFVAEHVVQNKWLLLLGGAYLVFLAFSHFAAAQEEEEGVAETPAAGARSFWLVVLNVELADLAFSLDNVVAAVALSRVMWVVLTGVFLGILTMRFAAGVFTRLIDREPILEEAAYLLVMAIGLELFAEELFGAHISHGLKFLISLGIIAATLLYVRLAWLRAVGQRLLWIRRVMALLTAAARTLYGPIGWAMRRTLHVGRRAVHAGRRAMRSRRTQRAAPEPAPDPAPETRTGPGRRHQPSGGRHGGS